MRGRLRISPVGFAPRRSKRGIVWGRIGLLFQPERVGMTPHPPPMTRQEYALLDAAATRVAAHFVGEAWPKPHISDGVDGLTVLLVFDRPTCDEELAGLMEEATRACQKNSFGRIH